MEVAVQPVLVDDEAVVIVRYKYNNEDVSFEAMPIELDAVGFDLGAAVIGEDYKSHKDTRREKNVKNLVRISGEGEKGATPFAAVTNGQGFKAHSLIHPAANPFVKQRTGESIEVAETVHTHEIIISAVEAAKRIKAECGPLPEGFINELKQQYPEGITTRIVDDLIKARKPKTETPINAKSWIIEGGAAECPADEFAEARAEAKKSKIA